jgi:hypothetical protein
MLARNLILDGTTSRAIQPGDVLALGEIIPATIATAAITISGAQLASGFILRSPGGAATDTIDTAANILNTVSGGLGYSGLQNGTTWRTTWIVSTAQTCTVTAVANTGVTVTNGAIAASSVKDFLVTVVNGTPPQTFVANTTNASAVVTGLNSSQTALLSPGMIVTNAVNGLQGTTILSVQPGAGVTMSGNANATSVAPGVAIAFSPQISVYGIGQKLL